MNLKIDETQIFEFLGPSSIIYHQKKWVLSFWTNRFESHQLRPELQIPGVQNKIQACTLVSQACKLQSCAPYLSNPLSFQFWKDKATVPLSFHFFSNHFGKIKEHESA